MKYKMYIIIFCLTPCILFYQNCGFKPGTSSSSSVDALGLGFNKIAPSITKGLGNQTVAIGLSGNLSGTKNLRNLEIIATPGAGEEFQSLTLKCEITGNKDITIQCNNRNFSEGKVRVNIGQKDDFECISGTTNIKYWVEDADPTDDSVPVLKSAAKSFKIQINDACYSENKIFPKEQKSQDNFASTVKMTDNYIFASAPGDDSVSSNSGAVQVFQKVNSKWTHSQTLKVSQSEADIKISAIDSSGTKLVIGSPFSSLEVGSVFAFQASGNNFTETQVLTPETPNSFGSDHYGHAVATDGQWLAVGAPNDSSENLIARGAIYLYQYIGGSWTFSKKLLGQTAYEELGSSLSMSSGYLVAGAPANFAGKLGPGSAYVFSNTGTAITVLDNAPDSTDSSIFGASVAVNGTKLIVGAPKAKGKKANTGAAYAYNFEGGSWKFKGKIQSSDGESDDEFAKSIAIEGNNLVIGARRESDTLNRKGSAYHYKYSSNKWNQTHKLMSRDRVERDYFGTSVSINKSDVVIGSQLDDGTKDNFIDGLGAMYVYKLK